MAFADLLGYMRVNTSECAHPELRWDGYGRVRQTEQVCEMSLTSSRTGIFEDIEVISIEVE